MSPEEIEELTGPRLNRVKNKFVCLPATLSCWGGFGQLQDLGLNMYDTRRKCDRSEDADGPVSGGLKRSRYRRLWC
jgi:hypothetical protein